MASPENLAKDALDLARRTNTQLFFLVGALLLVWLVNIEDGFRAIISKTPTVADLTVQVKNVSRIVGILDESIGQNQRKLANLQKAILPLSPNSQEYSDISEQIKSIQSILNNELEQINNIEQNRVRIESNFSDVSSALSARITVDVGQGLKLPFPFQIAMLAWIVILGYTILRVIVQRNKFWRMLSAGLSQTGAASGGTGSLRLTDVPPWLAPVPFRRGSNVRTAELAKAVGWETSWKLRFFAVGCVSIVLVLILLRVAWIGLVSNGVYVYLLDGKSLGNYGILIASALCIVFSVWLSVPPRTYDHQDDELFSSRERRTILLAGLALAAVFAVRGSSSARYFSAPFEGLIEEARKKYYWNKPRVTRVVDLSGGVIESGFYRNVRSGSFHYVRGDLTVTGCGGRLLASNLEPVDLYENLLMEGRGAKLGRCLGTGVEEEALSLVVAGKPGDAIELLLMASLSREQYLRRFRGLSGVKLAQRVNGTMRWLDLAAGLAIRYGFSLDPVIDRAHEITGIQCSAHAVACWDTRVANWTLPSGESWRHQRWGRDYPLRWDGRRYDV